VGLWVACGSGPTEPTDETETDGRVYSNEHWGFQLTIPAHLDWGLNVQTHLLWLDVNGQPKVQVRIYKPPEDGHTFSPLLYIEPRALTQAAELDSLVVALEGEYREAFRGYRIMGERRAVEVASEPGVEWTFTTHPVTEPGDHTQAERFLSTVVLHGLEVYVALGSGTRDDFPSEDFRSILGSVEFLK